MKSRHKRAAMIAGGLGALALATALVLSAFRQNLVFFFTPTQVAANEAPQGRTFRVGGMVEKGSVQRQPDGVTVRFVVTDTAKSIPVVYRGALPDLFREGKGVVTQGRLGADGAFPGERSAREARRELHAAGGCARGQTSSGGRCEGAADARAAAGAETMIAPELGQFALALALMIALVQGSLPLVGAHRGNRAWMNVARPAAQGQFVFVALAFGCLTYAFVTNDFSVALRGRAFEQPAAARVPRRRRVGRPRRLAPAVAAHARACGWSR